MVMGKSDKALEDFNEMDMSEWIKTLHHLGGDEINEILANMLLKLNEFGCLNYVL